MVDVQALDAPMTRVSGPVRPTGGMTGTGAVFLINHNADHALVTLRYQLKNAQFETAEEPFESVGRKFNRGSFIVRGAAPADMNRAAADLGIQITAVDAAPTVKTHPLRAPRIAMVHTWQSTQAEGWWRVEFDRLKVPYDYISTQKLASLDLRAKYDVIIFAPGGRGNPQTVVSGAPMYGNPLPWKKTDLTPNLGGPATAPLDETDDMRPGMGWTGLEHLQEFVRKGGLFITANDTTSFPLTFGMTPGVSSTPARTLKVTGSALRSKLVDAASPIVYGYSDNLGIFASNPPILGVSNMAGGGGGGRGGAGAGGAGAGGAGGERPSVMPTPTSC